MADGYDYDDLLACLSNDDNRAPAPPQHGLQGQQNFIANTNIPYNAGTNPMQIPQHTQGGHGNVQPTMDIIAGSLHMSKCTFL